MGILQDIPSTRVKYLARARAPTPPNEGKKFRNMLILAHFPSKYINFQMFVE